MSFSAGVFKPALSGRSKIKLYSLRSGHAGRRMLFFSAPNDNAAV